MKNSFRHTVLILSVALVSSCGGEPPADAEEAGAPEEGIPPGTRWEDVPDDFICPDCGVGKEDFEMVEI